MELATSDTVTVRPVLSVKLGEAQCALDEAAENGELQEGAYMRISNKLKDCVDYIDNNGLSAKLETFVDMTHYAPALAVAPIANVWPLGYNVVQMVVSAARKNNESDTWWNSLIQTYVKAIFDRNMAAAFEHEVSQLEREAQLRMDAFIDLVDLLLCSEDKKLSCALFNDNTCFMCYFTDFVDSKTIHDFAEGVMMRAPRLILNLCECTTHRKKGFTRLKSVAKAHACSCVWNSAAFTYVAGPSVPRRSKRNRSEAYEGNEEVYTCVECCD